MRGQGAAQNAKARRGLRQDNRRLDGPGTLNACLGDRTGNCCKRDWNRSGRPSTSFAVKTRNTPSPLNCMSWRMALMTRLVVPPSVWPED